MPSFPQSMLQAPRPVGGRRKMSRSSDPLSRQRAFLQALKLKSRRQSKQVAHMRPLIGTTYACWQQPP
eukprot:CAMPEP_0171241112 /NCGR_PEP_ID=MMETSP0790-20130122/44905_1 /TAXON_ID=2925 /ORGANISM="Alexandrium catenella, Strain OF101" /LENGTH=67 /DNA_ID=CAMNT_0011707667 /DNA_START=31 /DNA_END=230 /DNA_ORIENTATION=-